MRIIISSEGFSKFIEICISKRCEYMLLKPVSRELKCFYIGKNTDIFDHTVSFELDKKCKEKYSFTYGFNPLKLIKVKNYLDLLKDQPVVVDFDMIDEGNSMITVSNAVAYL